MADAWKDHLDQLGSFIRAQRQMANLSLRDLSELTSVSNTYLSQIERGLHEPSVRVLRSIAQALHLSSDVMLAQAGLLDEAVDGTDDDEGAARTEAAIRADRILSSEQKEALLAVYRSYVAARKG